MNKTSKYIAFFAVLLPVLISCDILPQQHFYYSDHSEITNPDEIAFVCEELNQIVPFEKRFTNLKIYTSLSKRLDEKITVLSSAYTEKVVDELRNLYPTECRFLDSLQEIRPLAGSGIIIIENKSRKIIVSNLNNAHYTTIQRAFLTHNALKTQGYLLTLLKGKKLSDTYAASLNPRVSNLFHTPENTTIAQSFYRSRGANLTVKPYIFYPKSDWQKLNKTLRTNLDFSDFNTGTFSGTRISLLDIVQAHLLIQNQGMYQKPSLIDCVKSSDKSLNYCAAKVKPVKILRGDVCENMQELFRLYMIQGKGQANYTKRICTEDCYIYSSNQYSYCNWCVYVNDAYTIGLIELDYLYSERFHNQLQKRKLFLKNLLPNIKKNVPISPKPGNNLRFIKRQQNEIREEII